MQSQQNKSAAGVGSLWNKNSWHWQQKKYSQWGKQQMITHLTVMSFKFKSMDFKVSQIRDFKGQTSVNIRKGKQIQFFQYQFTIDWKFIQSSSQFTLYQGFSNVHQFNQQDDEFTLQTTIKQGKQPPSGMLTSIKQGVNQNLLKIIFQFRKQLRQHDVDQKKLAADKIQREQQLQKMKQAQAKTGEIQKKMFQQQKEKDKIAKKIAQQSASSAPQKVENPAKVDNAEGSVWNSGSYFWEQKSVNKWAGQRLRELLRETKVEFPGGTAQIDEITKLQGESSVNIRKGKKLVGYDYNITMKWKLLFNDGDGKKIAQSTGTLVLEQVTNATGDQDEYQIQVNLLTDDTPNGQGKSGVKKHLNPEIRKSIAQFVDQLKKK